MALTLTHGGPTMFTAEAPSRELIVGTLKGLVFLERAGGGWRVERRELADRHISAALIEPESGTLVAGAFHGGLHASEDGGRSWESREVGISSDDIYSLAASSHGGSPRLWAGTEPAELFRSDDLGRSWRHLPELRSVEGISRWTFPAPPHVAHTKHINFDPSDPSIVYASIEQGGLLKSTDAGERWAEVPGMDDDVHRTVIHPKGRRLLVTGGDGVYASADGGETWEHWTGPDDDHIGGYPDQLVFRPSQPDTMVIAAARRNPGHWFRSKFAGARISKSDDGGRNWHVLDCGLPDGLQGNVEAMCLEDWGQGFSVFAATTAGEVFASDDGGEKWDCIARDLSPISKGGHYRALPS